MKVTYLSHSGFCVELENHILLFDYYKGQIPKFDQEKEIFVFASHKHPDHFNFSVFELRSKYSKIRYIFSSDIKLSDTYLERKGVSPTIKENMISIGRHKTEMIGSVQVTTLQSTDQGVAFLVTCEGKTIYHAGDLNWWHWEGEAEQDNTDMKNAYQREINSIGRRHIDIAFVPLDPRQEEAYDWGMNYFLEHTDADVIFPMHMWGKYDWIGRYKKSLPDPEQAARIMEILKEGQTWNI